MEQATAQAVTSSVSEVALTEYDFILAIDTSGSMGEPDKHGKTRWENMQESAIAFVRDIEKIDGDGVGIVTFGSTVESFDGCNSDKVREIFASRSPRGSTPLAEGLTAALALAGKSDKPDFILVLTDGVPNDKAAAAKVIADAANKLERDEDLTFLFVQVGNDKSASEYLRQLDDELTGAKFDIVDAKTIEEADQFPSTTALIIAAIAD